MPRHRATPFEHVRVEGALLPVEILGEIHRGSSELPGLAPRDYGLAGKQRLQDAISRSWARLRPLWSAFRERLAGVDPGDPAIGLTRERWLLPLLRELGFDRLARHRFEVEGRPYPVSHLQDAAPVHLLGWNVDLDRRSPGVEGAARTSPHALLQELLNREDDHLWGIVANGRTLRILRDHYTLSRQAFVEFDLEGIFADEAFADFALLWLVAHASRFAPREGGPETCWLERWARAGERRGMRALDTLREGVEQALETLGAGFLRPFPENRPLREALRTGRLSAADYYRQLLRLVYRLLFLFVAEDRDLLLVPLPGPGDPRREEVARARERYRDWYAAGRLRERALRPGSPRHRDLWAAFLVVARALGSEEGCPPLALPFLGGLWDPAATPDLDRAVVANAELLAAIRHLAWVEERNVLRPVDFRNLGAEELGSVYESLLELHPEVEVDAGRFKLGTAAGNERRQTGSYYTPAPLIDSLLETALDPVVDEALARATAAARRRGLRGDDLRRAREEALLSLRVCDPAAGSGHFLVAAAHRLARRLAVLRCGDREPSPADHRHALRDVVVRCLYAVDLNPMAVELCRVSLWLEAMEPGLPLAFLDHHVRCGNSLLGATPELLAAGIPDGAYQPVTGDDPAICRELKKFNREARGGQGLLAFGPEERQALDAAAREAAVLRKMDDSTPAAVAAKRSASDRLARRLAPARRLADAWCAAFAFPKRPGGPRPVTTDTLARLRSAPGKVPGETLAEIERLAARFRFFHWHLEFPDVFGAPGPGEGAGGGFDVVLGNPPWEHTELKEKEFFASLRPEIAALERGADRKRAIEALREEDPALYQRFVAEKRAHDVVSHFVRRSERYPACGRGRINTYAVFAELMASLAPAGRVGCVVPTGIATDHTTGDFFRRLVETGRLASLYDFENRKKVFPAVDSRQKFCLLTLRGPGDPDRPAEFAFFLHDVEELADPERRFALAAGDFALINPNTRTCPVFRTRADAELARHVYRRVPVLVREPDGDRPEENPWRVSFRQGLFNMTSDSHLFRTREELEAEGARLAGNLFARGEETWLPLYEAKMIHQFDHRFGNSRDLAAGARPRETSPDGHADPARVPLPRYWVPAGEVARRLAGRWDRPWLLGWRDIARATDERTVIAAVIPRVGVGNNLPLSLVEGSPDTPAGLAANAAAFALDYVARLKVGGTHLNFYLTCQLPFLPPDRYREAVPFLDAPTLGDWIAPRVAELAFTAWDLEGFARDLGFPGPPFRWDPERRFLLRCELDAAFFHLYLGTPEEWRREASPALRERFPAARDAVEYILETFPIVRRHDEERHGSFRTRDTILDIYDRMAEAAASGRPWRTLLDPPPADPSLRHSPDTRPGWVDRLLRLPAPPPGAPGPARRSSRRSSRPGQAPAGGGPDRLPFDDDRPPAGTSPATPPSRPASAPRPRRDDSAPGAPLATVLAWLRDHPGPRSRAEILAGTGLPPSAWTALRPALRAHPRVLVEGNRRSTRYAWRP